MTFGELDLDYRDYLVIDDKLYRPAEVNVLRGDYSKAEKSLGWKPSVKFEGLVEMMVRNDLNGIAEPRAKNNLETQVGVLEKITST